MNNDELNRAIITNIKETIKESIDKEYTEYKNKCLQELNSNLEAQRNKTVSAILDGIDIYINNNQPYSLEPIIQIKIEKRVIVKGD